MLTLMLILQAHLHLKTPMECHLLTFRELFLSTNILSVQTFKKTYATLASDLLKMKKSNLSKKTMFLYSIQKTVNITVLTLSIPKSRTISSQPRKKANTGSHLTLTVLMQMSLNQREQLKEMGSLLNLPISSSRNSFLKLLEWILPK